MKHLRPSPLRCAGGGNAPACPGGEVETSDEADVASGPPTPEGKVRGAAEIELPLKETRHSLSSTCKHICPNMPFCEACIRGNMTRKHARTCKPADMTLIPTKFGEHVTADRLAPNRTDPQGVEGSAYAVVIFDIGTYPTAAKGATEARLSLQDYTGPRQTVSSLQCDGAKELYKAAVELGLSQSHLDPTCHSPTRLRKGKVDTSKKERGRCLNSVASRLLGGHMQPGVSASRRTPGNTNQARLGTTP